MNSNPNCIRGRLQEKLRETDIIAIKEAVLRWIIHENIKVEQIKIDVAVGKDLLKHVKPLSKDWE